MSSPPFEDDPALYILTSLTAGSSHIVTATSRLETILRANRVPFKALDLATDEKARRLWARRAGKDPAGRARKLPSLMQEGWIIGDLVEVDEWNEYGELKQHVKIHYDEHTIPSINDKPPAPKLKRTVKKTTGSTKAATAISGVAAAAAAEKENAEKAGAASDTRKSSMQSLADEAALKAKELKLSSLKEKVRGAEDGDGKDDKEEETKKGTKKEVKIEQTKEKETGDETENKKVEAKQTNDTTNSDDKITDYATNDLKAEANKEPTALKETDHKKDGKATATKPAESKGSEKKPHDDDDNDDESSSEDEADKQDVTKDAQSAANSTDKTSQPMMSDKPGNEPSPAATGAGLQSPTSSTWKDVGHERLMASMQSPTSGRWKKMETGPAQDESGEDDTDGEEEEEKSDKEKQDEEKETRTETTVPVLPSVPVKDATTTADSERKGQDEGEEESDEEEESSVKR